MKNRAEKYPPLFLLLDLQRLRRLTSIQRVLLVKSACLVTEKMKQRTNSV